MTTTNQTSRRDALMTRFRAVAAKFKSAILAETGASVDVERASLETETLIVWLEDESKREAVIAHLEGISAIVGMRLVRVEPHDAECGTMIAIG